MSTQMADEPVTASEVVRLPRGGRTVRLALAAVVLVLMAIGSFWGSDDAFPFGPWKMYAGRADPNAAVVSTRVVGLTAAGAEISLSGGQVGLRRAEFEGQLPRVEAHPELLDALAAGFAARNPDAPQLVSVQVVDRQFEMRDGVQTGGYTDRVVVDEPLGTR